MSLKPEYLNGITAREYVYDLLNIFKPAGYSSDGR
jgi:hypothetical protein